MVDQFVGGEQLFGCSDGVLATRDEFFGSTGIWMKAFSERGQVRMRDVHDWGQDKSWQTERQE